MARVLSKLMSGRRVTMPKGWCAEQGVKIGDFVAVDYDEGSASVVVSPVEVKVKVKK